MNIQDMVGLTPINIKQDGDEIVFEFTSGRIARFYHSQDCCETVSVEDVNGDWKDLIGQPLLVAEERVESPLTTDGYSYHESATWTFYTFRGINGSVDVRWGGYSNGYYSEAVHFEMFWTPEIQMIVDQIE